jgi:hypothetical protein
MFNKTTTDALLAWLQLGTWNHGHSCDEGRFYNFILAAWHENHSLWNDSTSLESMLSQAKSLHPNYPDLEKVIRSYHKKGTLILDFLSFTKCR